MFKGIIENIFYLTQEAGAFVDPAWNHKFRPVTDSCKFGPSVLPDKVARFYENCERALGVRAFAYGSALDSLARGLPPKDWDTYFVGHKHPLLMLHDVETYARRQGFAIIPYRRRVRHLWKRTRVQTPDGELFTELNAHRPQLIDLFEKLNAQNALPEKTDLWLPHLRDMGISEDQCRLFRKRPAGSSQLSLYLTAPCR